MVVLLDLDDEGLDPLDPHAASRNGFTDPRAHLLERPNGDESQGKVKTSEVVEVERVNPNINGFSASLGCYP